MKPITRRKLFTMTGIGVAAGLSAPLVRWGISDARAAEKLDPEDPTAKALGYHHNSSNVDPNQWPRHEASQNCANCNLAQNADGESEWIGCQIFPNKHVNRNGWCNSWVKASG